MTVHEALPGVDELVARTATTQHCPSISWGIVIDGALARAGSTGAVQGAAPTADTVYRIASMTKSFTSAAVLALRDEGVLSLDDPITLHAPELAAVAPPTIDGGPIRVRHLLSMSGGMATDDPWADRHIDITDDELDAVLADGVLFAGVTGSSCEYSNLGFGLLGRIVKRATGRRVQDLVSERLLGPLGMDRTSWLPPRHDDWARPFRVQDGAAVADRGAPLGDGEIAPMGGIWTTVADLARWVAWLDDATPARDSIDDGPLCRASRREMQEIQRYAGMRSLAGRPTPSGYGFGLWVSHEPSLGRVVGHSGGFPGYGSNMRWIAGRRVGVIALANVTYAPMADLTMRIIDVLHDHDALPRAPVLDSPLLVDIAGRLIDLLQDWHDEVADELFADNVVLDEPYDRRRIASERLVAECGGSLHLERVEATTATEGRLVLRRPSGTPLRMKVQIAPTRPPRVQLYEPESD